MGPGNGDHGAPAGDCVAPGVRQSRPGTPIKSVLSVSRLRRCQADLRGICPSRATAGTTGREAGFGKGPPATGAPGRQGCLRRCSLWDQTGAWDSGILLGVGVVGRE